MGVSQNSQKFFQSSTASIKHEIYRQVAWVYVLTLSFSKRKIWGQLLHHCFLTPLNENKSSAHFIGLAQGLSELKFVELRMVLGTY